MGEGVARVGRRTVEVERHRPIAAELFQRQVGAIAGQHGAHGGQPVGRVAGQFAQRRVAGLLPEVERIKVAAGVVGENVRLCVRPAVQPHVGLLQIGVRHDRV